MLFERVTRWTDPPCVTADVSGLLGQAVLPPWAGQPRLGDDGTTGKGPEDDRPAEAVAAGIARTAPEQDEGDGSAPADPDDSLRSFVQAVTDTSAREHDGGWPGALREYVPDAGPVPSSRFA